MQKNNKNLIVAVTILIGFIFFWDKFVASRYAPPKRTPPVVDSSQMKESSPSSLVNSVGPTGSNSNAVIPPEPGVIMKTILEAEGVQVTIDPRGGRVTSWRLHEGAHWIEFVNPKKTALVFPLETDPDLLFSAVVVSPRELRLSAVHPAGYHITKTLSLLAQPPFHKLVLSFSNPTPRAVQVNTDLVWGEGLGKHAIGGDADDHKTFEATLPEMRALAFADKVYSWKSGFVFNRSFDQTVSASYNWAGVDNNHFLAALIPDQAISHLQVKANRDTAPQIRIPLTVLLKPGETARFNYQLYVGPKKGDLLNSAGHNLIDSIDYGMFGVVSKILLRGLNFFQGLTSNYGWAIILLTICVQIAVFPLTRKSLKHSVRMKELQPQLKKLQEQFKTDPKRLQIETFNLYKKNGMKFMGMEGCFPMLLQMPVFFAFYAALNVAYELRGAPWIFWVRDLAAPDPFYVLPIIMGAGMFLQQKMTAVAADPAQAKMMMIMPFIFTFMFLKLPAGLVLYWSINSVATILTMLIMRPQNKPLELKVV